MKRVGLTSILFIVFSFSVYAQYIDLSQQKNYADYLYNEKNYASSLKEYLRLYYYDKENAYPSTCHDIATNFLALNDLDNALKYLDLYYFTLKNEEEKNNLKYEKQKIYLLKGDHNRALIEILQINKKVDYDKDRYHFMLACNYLFANDFEKAKTNIYKLSYIHTIDTLALNKKLKSLIKNDHKNPKNARWYSSVIPGLGQTVNGDLKGGINSLALYVGFWALFFDLSTEIGVANSAVSVGPWLIRYYLGGLQNAVKSAKINKFNKKQTYILETINLIEKGKQQKIALTK